MKPLEGLVQILSIILAASRLTRVSHEKAPREHIERDMAVCPLRTDLRLHLGVSTIWQFHILSALIIVYHPEARTSEYISLSRLEALHIGQLFPGLLGVIRIIPASATTSAPPFSCQEGLDCSLDGL
jgi:hypothetical protein